MANIKNYQLIERISITNANAIYKVSLGNEVFVMKRLKTTTSSQDAERLKQEALFLSNINSEYVISLKSFFEGDVNSSSYIILEYFRGITLENYLSLKTKLTVLEATDIIKQIALGLKSIHEKNIVHQDIGLKNIMINDLGNIKIIDFGASKKVGQPSINLLLQAHGTAHYISPETVMGKNIDGKSDIYSLGLVFSELLTGEKVYNGVDDKEISVKRVINEIVPIPNTIQENVRKIIENMCKFSPDERFSAQDVINSLKYIS